jgi:DNA-binding XRE family transcriptional regulator
MINYEKMREIRVKRQEEIGSGWTQGGVAKMVGVSAQTYRQWEWGHNSPSPSNMEILLKIFGDSIEEN